MEDQDARNLVKLAAAGNAEAFSRLVDAHYMMVYKVAYKWCGRREDAEDIAQEVFIKLPEKLDSYRGEASFSTWLFRLVVNATKDYGRKSASIAYRELPFADGFDAESDDIAADLRMIATESYATIHTLPEPIRDAVLLVFGEDMNHKEAGVVLGCAESTVSWRIFQARKLLKGMANAG